MLPTQLQNLNGFSGLLSVSGWENFNCFLRKRNWVRYKIFSVKNDSENDESSNVQILKKTTEEADTGKNKF